MRVIRADRLVHLWVRTADQCEGGARTDGGEHLVRRVLVRSDVPFTHLGGTEHARRALERGDQAHEPGRP